MIRYIENEVYSKKLTVPRLVRYIGAEQEQNDPEVSLATNVSNNQVT